ncbi:hypothetical protein D052_0765 [Vibrio parahaemolyticus 10290]|nr:hypothetical protein D052_0765 [Vibrio parahaemolyticus 10290]
MYINERHWPIAHSVGVLWSQSVEISVIARSPQLQWVCFA